MKASEALEKLANHRVRSWYSGYPSLQKPTFLIFTSLLSVKPPGTTELSLYKVEFFGIHLSQTPSDQGLGKMGAFHFYLSKQTTKACQKTIAVRTGEVCKRNILLAIKIEIR